MDTDLIKNLEEMLHGGIEAKLFEDIIYQSRKDRLGEIIYKQRPALTEKRRREKAITQLVQRCPKNWRKANQAGLKAV